MPALEELACQNIDKQLEASGWIIQSRRDLNLSAARGVAVREFPLETAEADYLLFVDRKAVGVVEAKYATTLSGVANQAAKYSVGLPPNIPHVSLPLPFLYESTVASPSPACQRDSHIYAGCASPSHGARR